MPTYLHRRAKLVNLIRTACRHKSAPKTPKMIVVGISINPAAGVITTKPEIAPMNVESSDHFPVSAYVMAAQVSAPVDAHRFVTHTAMTDWKLSVSVVPASKANHEPQMMIMERSWLKELPGR